MKQRIISILLVCYFLVGLIDTSKAQCRFADATKQLQYETLIAIVNKTPSNSAVRAAWFPLIQGTDCDVCKLPRIACDNDGYITNLDLNNIELEELPRSIGQLSKLQHLQLYNNYLTCLPKELGNLCGIESIQNGLSGNPIAATINWCDFCAIPQDICVGQVPESLMPVSFDCEQIRIEIGDGKLRLKNLKATSTQIRLLAKNSDWREISNCNGNCPETVDIEPLTSGEYLIEITLGDGFRQSCTKQEKIKIKNSTDPLRDDAANCDALDLIVDAGQITVRNLKATYGRVQIVGANTNWRTVIICDGDCDVDQVIPDLHKGSYFVKIIQYDQYGNFCFIEEELQVLTPSESLGRQITQCDSIAVIGVEDSIKIHKLYANYNRIELLSKSAAGNTRTICDGNCEPTEIITNLSNGTYSIKAFQYGVDGSYCYDEWELEIKHNKNTDRAHNAVNLASHQKDQQVVLQWTVHNPDNMRYFLVERSSDGLTFEVLDLIQNETAKHAFNWMDIQPYTNKNYYRIRQVFKDFQVVYSPVRMEKFKARAQLIATPNPANDYLTLYVNPLVNKNISLHIYNTFGQLLQSLPVQILHETTLTLDIQSLESGIYWLSVKVEGEKLQTLRFVKEHWR